MWPSRMGRVEQRGAWPFTVRASQGHLLIPKYFFFEGIDPQILSYRDDSHVLATPTARRGRSKLSFLLLLLTGELCRLLRALERSGLIPDPRRKINHGAAYQAPGNRMNKLPTIISTRSLFKFATRNTKTDQRTPICILIFFYLSI